MIQWSNFTERTCLHPNQHNIIHMYYGFHRFTPTVVVKEKTYPPNWSYRLLRTQGSVKIQVIFFTNAHPHMF